MPVKTRAQTERGRLPSTSTSSLAAAAAMSSSSSSSSSRRHGAVELAHADGLGDTPRAVFAQTFVPLLVSALASLLPGVLLDRYADEIAGVPGLLALIPPTIGLRGNVFGSITARMTAFVQLSQSAASLPRRLRGLYLLATGEVLALSQITAVLCVVVARATATAPDASFVDLLFISLLAAAASGYLLLNVAGVVVARAYNAQLNPDNVATPLVITLGDLVSVPIVLAAARVNAVAPLPLKPLFIALALSYAARAYRDARRWSSKAESEKKVNIRERFVVLCACTSLSFAGGLVLEASADATSRYLIFVPLLNAAAGNIGSVLASRLQTYVALDDGNAGALRSPLPPRWLLRDAAACLASALAVFALVAALVVAVGLAPAHMSPLAVFVLLESMVALLAVVAMSLAFVTVRTSLAAHLDPSNVAIPVVCAAMDCVSCASLAFVVQRAFGGSDGGDLSSSSSSSSSS